MQWARTPMAKDAFAESCLLRQRQSLKLPPLSTPGCARGGGRNLVCIRGHGDGLRLLEESRRGGERPSRSGGHEEKRRQREESRGQGRGDARQDELERNNQGQ